MKKYFLALGALSLAFFVLSISVFRATTTEFASNAFVPFGEKVLGESAEKIDYVMPFPGKVLPDSPLWVFKAARDQVWIFLTPGQLKKAELALLFSDKRLEASRTLFENNKPDIALSVLTKGEKYLEMAAGKEAEARSGGADTSDFLVKLASSSLKHREVIEKDILPIAPEDAKPEIVKAENYAKSIYKSSRDALNGMGLTAPESPFVGD
ncbi:MAG TPA: DUF5667 domain-containing protein [Patescibacteria group bacterium]|nr:DUF5667 domain-containing protein [Patescibacteria group bacterium]